MANPQITLPAQRLSLKCPREVDTRQAGLRLGQVARPGDVIALYGELGAGKTVLVKGLADGLGITDVINSPTFTLVVFHPGKIGLHHIDAYRLENPRREDLLEIGILELLESDGVCAIEWAGNVAAWLPPHRLEVSLEHISGGRLLTVNAVGPEYIRYLEALSSHGPAVH